MPDHGQTRPVPVHPQTLSVHAGEFIAPQNAPAGPPLFQASSYRFRDLDEVEAVYAAEKPGVVYGRYGGPNGLQFAAAIAELEGAEAAVASSSGMSAINAALATQVPDRGAIVVSRELYGGTYALLTHEYAAPRAQVIAVDIADFAATEAALRSSNAKVLYVEALTNPLIRVADLPQLAEIARRNHALLIVDATFASPVLIQPIRHGADLVVHSVTKYISGHGDVGAGILSGRRELIQQAQSYLIRTGATIPHFESWLALRGFRTLAIRMAHHSANARIVAAFLAQQPLVERVHHPSLPDHPHHHLAEQLYPHGIGGMLAFDLRGKRPAVEHFLAGLRRIDIVHSLGEIATTISYSAVASHRAVPAELREQLGVTAGTLRLSIGIEHPDDIIADLAHAFAGLSSTIHA